jgi:purine-cytosine permease-like protein
MWLPTPVYEALPWALILAGALLVTAGYFSGAQSVQSFLLVAGAVLAVVGVVLLLKRRDYRMSRSRARYDRVD